MQGELRAAIERVTGESVLPQGSGRTDAGVHALGQVASFPLSAPIPEASLARALNRALPASIRVLSAKTAHRDFHARRSIAKKVYEYRIFRGELCPPWLARYVYAFHQPLDLPAMERAAGKVLGTHDFTSFAATDPEKEQRASGESGGPDGASPADNVRTIYESRWVAEERVSFGPQSAAYSMTAGGEFLIYRVAGNGFLHHMVRNLVGTFLEVGRQRRSAEDIPAVLAALARRQAGATAPARGLFLAAVEYADR